MPAAGPQDELGSWLTDADPIYTFLGIYLTSYQWLEGKLDQIILLDAGHDLWADTQRRLASMTSKQKMDAVSMAVEEGPTFQAARQRGEWIVFFKDVMARVETERLRRNSLIHSHYLMKRVELGLNVIRSDRRPGANAPRFTHEEMSLERMNAILSEVAFLAFDLGQVHVQLIHATP